KEFKDDNEVVIIHTGGLNEGHLVLKQQHGLNIISIKEVGSINQIKPQIIFVDETQRMRPHQLSFIIDYVEANDIYCIFAIDPKQILSLEEWNYNNKQTLIDLKNNELYPLSKKIRTNKELGAFIKGLFDLNQMKYCNSTENLSIHYFKEIE